MSLLGRQTRDGVAVRRVQVMLDDETVERAKALGDGNVSQGIRQAIASLPTPTRHTSQTGASRIRGQEQKMNTIKLEVLARPIRRGLLRKGVAATWQPAIFKNGTWILDLPSEVDVTAAIEAAAIATRAINESADVYAVAEEMRAEFVALAAEIAREAR